MLPCPALSQMCGSEQGILQHPDQLPGTGSAQATVSRVPVQPREPLQLAGPCDESDSHTAILTNFLFLPLSGHHKSLKTEQHCSQGQEALDAEENWEDEPGKGRFARQRMHLRRAKTTSCLAPAPPLKFMSPSQRTHLGLGCWPLSFSTLPMRALL